MTTFPLWNPVAKNNFYVFLVNAEPQGALEWVGAITSFVQGLGLALIQGTFSEIQGIDGDMDMEEYFEGGRNAAPHRFMKRGKSPPLLLKRGVTLNTDLWDWHSTVLLGTARRPLRKHGLILLTDHGWGLSGEQASPTASAGIPGGFGVPILDKPPIAAWCFLNSLPQKLSGPMLDATKSEVAVEELTLVHEGLYRLGPGLIPGGFGEGLALAGL